MPHHVQEVYEPALSRLTFPKAQVTLSDDKLL